MIYFDKKVRIQRNGGVNYYDFGVKEGYKYTSMRVESRGRS